LYFSGARGVGEPIQTWGIPNTTRFETSCASRGPKELFPRVRVGLRRRSDRTALTSVRPARSGRPCGRHPRGCARGRPR
jgi:hypothetical protein